MIVTIEISHYPLQETYERPILAFIEELKHPSVIVRTTAMSTYVKGEIADVFDRVKAAISRSSEEAALSSTVFKLIPKDLPIEDGYMEF